MEINITDYLSTDEIKEICSDELRIQIQKYFRDEKNANRLISNLSYQFMIDEIEKITPNYEKQITEKVAKLIAEKDLSFYLFDFDSYGGGRSKSLGAKIYEQAVEENKDIIKSRIAQCIKNKDFSEEIFAKFENLSENFMSNIYELVDLMRGAKNKDVQL